MLPDHQPTICPIHLLEIHSNGTWIGMLNQDQKWIQLLVWNGWLVEIECRYKHQQWTPIAITYRVQTPSYQEILEKHLSYEQLQCLRSAIQACSLN